MPPALPRSLPRLPHLLAALLLLAAPGARAQGRGHAAEGLAPQRQAAGEQAPGGGAPQPTTPPADRPSEDDLFGGGNEEAPATPAEPSAPAGAEDERPGDPDAQGKPKGEVRGEAGAEADRDSDVLSGPGSRSAFDAEEGGAVDDPLRIGGQFYLRGQGSANSASQLSTLPLSAPTLVDVYLDARPNDRVRAFASGRLVYDASLPLGGATSQGALAADPNNPTTDSAQGSGSSTAGTGLFGTARANPTVLLDQAWLRFDIERQVFLTVGKQQVRWGVSRFFIPTDYLSPSLRDPLAVFDARLGASMVKVHVPVESLGWNFYGVALLDNFGPASQLGQVGGALRAEVLLGPAEVAAGAVFQRGLKPRYALNVSAPLGPLDVYAELALRRGWNRQVLRVREGADPYAALSLSEEGVFGFAPGGNVLQVLSGVEQVPVTGWVAQASGGASLSLAYSEQDTVTVGAEYFYNSLGTEDRRDYPAQLLLGTYQPFYAARHYGALYAVLLDPGPLERTQVVLSNIVNVSDLSALGRIDVIYRALQFLQVEAYASANYGRPGGEFRLGLDFGQLPLFGRDGQPLLNPDGSVRTVEVKSPVPVASFGVGLRINI
jgi:hypothetical protein